jgi:hypothetical protein
LKLEAVFPLVSWELMERTLLVPKRERELSFSFWKELKGLFLQTK